MSFRYMVIGSEVLRAEPKAGVGVVGPISTSTSLERALEVRGDELPHLLRLQVVRVVVAGGQHVRAGHDAALHFRAEAFAARALVEVHAGRCGSLQRWPKRTPSKRARFEEHSAGATT